MGGWGVYSHFHVQPQTTVEDRLLLSRAFDNNSNFSNLYIFFDTILHIYIYYWLTLITWKTRKYMKAAQFSKKSQNITFSEFN